MWPSQSLRQARTRSRDLPASRRRASAGTRPRRRGSRRRPASSVSSPSVGLRDPELGDEALLRGRGGSATARPTVRVHVVVAVDADPVRAALDPVERAAGERSRGPSGRGARRAVSVLVGHHDQLDRSGRGTTTPICVAGRYSQLARRLSRSSEHSCCEVVRGGVVEAFGRPDLRDRQRRAARWPGRRSRFRICGGLRALERAGLDVRVAVQLDPGAARQQPPATAPT